MMNEFFSHRNWYGAIMGEFTTMLNACLGFRNEECDKESLGSDESDAIQKESLD